YRRRACRLAGLHAGAVSPGGLRGQLEPERRADARHAVDADAPSMGLDEALDGREAEAEAIPRPVAHPRVGLEDQLLRAGQKSRARVRDLDADGFVVALHAHDDAPLLLLTHELDGVSDQIGRDAREDAALAGDGPRFLEGLEAELGAGGRGGGLRL